MNNEYLKLKNEKYKAKIPPTVVDRIFALAEAVDVIYDGKRHIVLCHHLLT